MFRGLCVAALSLFLFCEAALAWGSSSNSPPSVAIIGGGAAGLSAAWELKKIGYQVTVFEKESKVGGFAKTTQVDGLFYDQATMFVPGGSIAGNGIANASATLANMIRRSGAGLVDAVDFFHLDDNNEINIIPEVLSDFTTDEIIDQLITGLAYTHQLMMCSADPTTCAECGAVCASASMNLREFGETFGIPAYGSLIPYVIDGLGASPAAFISSFGSTISSFATADVVFLLQNLGVTIDDLPRDGVPQPPNMEDLLKMNHWFFFDHGYQNFFIKFAHKTGLNVRVNSDIQTLRQSNDGRWVVTSTGGSMTFDEVIVTAPPQDAIPLLEGAAGFEDRVALLATAVPSVPPNDVFLVRSSNTENTPADLLDAVAFWPSGLGIGTPDFISPAVGGAEKIGFFQRRHQGKDVWIIASFSLDTEKTIEEVYEQVREVSLDRFGLDLAEDWLVHERFTFPSGPASRSIWNAAWEELQGVDGLWFAGEAFGSSGIPLVVEFSAGLVECGFPPVSQGNQEGGFEGGHHHHRRPMNRPYFGWGGTKWHF